MPFIRALLLAAALLAVPATAQAAPPAPAALAATPAVERVNLAWSASSGASGYHVWRRPTAGGTWARLASPQTVAYADTTAVPGVSFTYSVRAFNASGVSASSPFAVATALEAPPAGGAVLWTADGSLPLEREWAEYSTDQNCAVDSAGRTDTRFTRQSTVVAQGAYAYRSHLVDGDSCYQERSEVGQDYPTRVGFSETRRFLPGRDYYVSFQIRLGAGFPVNATGWQLVTQWKQVLGGSACCPMMAMQVHHGRFWFENAGGTHARVDMGSATTGVWHRFTVHFLVSHVASVGYVEAWGDGGSGPMAPVAARAFMRTTDTSAATGLPLPVSARIGIYRNPGINQAGGSSDAFYDGYTVAQSRAAAEANAFAE